MVDKLHDTGSALICARFGFLTVILVKMQVFSDVMPGRLAHICLQNAAQHPRRTESTSMFQFVSRITTIIATIVLENPKQA